MVTERKVDLSRDRKVKALKCPAGKGRVDVFDLVLPGFCLRISESGAKSWSVYYRPVAGPHKGKLTRHVLEPRYPALTCRDARDKAGKVLAAVSEGGDPHREKQAERKAPAPARPAEPQTFAEIRRAFVDRYCKGPGGEASPRLRTWKETERLLTVNCSAWDALPLASITRRHASDLLYEIGTVRGPYVSNRTLAALRKMFRWAANKGDLESSPMDYVESDFQEKPNTRFYSDDETRAVWEGTAKLDPLEAGFIKLLTLLGVRKGELAGMRRSELDNPKEPTLWTVPPERVKGRADTERVYVVPLPKLAQRILKSLPQAHPDLVFQGRHRGKPIDAGTPLKLKVQEASGVDDWTYHPTRRTVSTWLQNEGHDEFDRGLVLNHAEATITGRNYSQGFGTDRKRELLEKWAEHVEKLVTPAGVSRLA